MLVTKKDAPVEFIIEPRAASDIKVAQSFRFDIPKGSKIMQIEVIQIMATKIILYSNVRYIYWLEEKKMLNARIEVCVKKLEKLLRLLLA